MTMTLTESDPSWTPYIRFVALVARSLVRIPALGRVQISEMTEVPSSGPLIVVANHISNLDPPLLGGWLGPALRRRPRFLAKEALFKGPMGWFLRSQGVVPVKAGGSDMEAYRTAKAILDVGGVVVILPEGTRSQTGVLGVAKPGVALLATRTGVPVLPLGISNTDRLLGRGSSMPRWGTPVQMVLGRPFTLRLDPELPRREALGHASDEMMRRIAGLVEPRHRGTWEPWQDDTAATPPADGTRG
jgi:1-acyl-sn-glycerol-3-phosphate acyltransferase